jgi:hypothetical protein
MKPNNFDPTKAVHLGVIRQQRPADASMQYTDAELYRIVVAQALTNGTVLTKADFDAIVRTLGNISGADELIAFRDLRLGCRAWRYGKRMVCECGVTWAVDTPNPPRCKGRFYG